MTQLHELIPGIYALGVPMDGFGFKIDEWFTGKKNISCSTKGPMWSSDWLPPGNWSIICCSATATEEEAGNIAYLYLGGHGEQLRDYFKPDSSNKDIILSLIRSKGLDPAKNWLILKQQNNL